MHTNKLKPSQINEILEHDSEIETEEDTYLSSNDSKTEEKTSILSHTHSSNNNMISKKTTSFASLPSDGSLYHKQDSDEQQSDFLDSLQILSISIQNEIELIKSYFNGIKINILENDINIFDDDIKLYNNNNINAHTPHSMSSMTFDFKMIQFIINAPNSMSNPIELYVKCSDNYPNGEQSCYCRSISCSLLSKTENQILKNHLNFLAESQLHDGHNCIIIILISLENRFNNYIYRTIDNNINNNNNNNDNNKSNYGSNNSLHSLNGNNNSTQLQPISVHSEQGFFDSLNSIHLNPYDNDKKKKEDKILPSSFSSLQDIQTTKTRDEKKLEYKYNSIDNGILAPKMCGVTWGKFGQLIFFNNILIKNKNKNNIKQDRNAIITFNDYNKYIESYGCQHIHSDELHSIRKHVFANHFDEDEDRFADEFIVGFSLSNNNIYNKNEINKNKNKNKTKYYRYKNAYLHRSVSFMHQQHHNVNNNNYLINIHHNKQHQKNRHHKHRHSNGHIYINNGHNGHNGQRREGNAKIFYPGIVKFNVNMNFSLELVGKHKLIIDNKYKTITDLCIYNQNICKQLGLNRLKKRLKVLSSFLENNNNGINILEPSVYCNEYRCKFIEKIIDELYLHCDIQGISIIACLLRQSQYFALLFCNENINYNYGYLLKCCVNQYLKIIKYRINQNNISDLNELENFKYTINKQQIMFEKQIVVQK